MSEYLWNEKNNTFTWFNSLYSPFKTEFLMLKFLLIIVFGWLVAQK